jgi:hypothetical protein
MTSSPSPPKSKSAREQADGKQARREHGERVPSPAGDAQERSGNIPPPSASKRADPPPSGEACEACHANPMRSYNRHHALLARKEAEIDTLTKVLRWYVDWWHDELGVDYPGDYPEGDWMAAAEAALPGAVT